MAHTWPGTSEPAGSMAPTDYQTLIDAPTWAFIARTNACYPDDTATRSIAEQRTIYDAMCRAFHRGYPSGVTAQDAVIAGVPCRRYHGARLSVIYIHGGGFLLGGLQSHDDICAEICARTGFEVISVDYRLAPEHKHPAAFQDALAVCRAIAEIRSYLLVGDSAGANIAASVAHASRGSASAPLGQVLIYPGLGGNLDRGSYLTHANAPMHTLSDVQFYAGIRHENALPSKTDPTACALHDTDFTALPATAVFSAECDPIADDGRDYCAAIITAGGKATWHLERGLVHGYLRARHTVPRATESFNKIITAISTLGAAS